MRLTKQTDFALRTLMYLAKQAQGRRVFAQEIAEAYDMPINHLTKIVHKLSLLGYINTYRGRNGGIELAKASADISVRQVIEDFEPSLNPADCQSCKIKGQCDLQDHLAVASEAFLQSLGETRLADMI
ncbi:MAG: transcriptional repressor NsrR [Gammaproteobacteria bacterium]|nr:MAG: transcriptional repressor NsrR [Gammaproteobacteria bacterium]